MRNNEVVWRTYSGKTSQYMAPASYDVGPAQSDLALMTKPAATEMLRFRTTGGAENGEGGDLEKPFWQF
jgi:hypothetical protein